MADRTLKKLIDLIESGESAELRRTAIIISGEIAAAQDGAVVKTLTALLDDPDLGLRTTAMEALGKLKAQTALPKLVERVREGGAEVEAAARAASQMGARGAAAMEKVMTDAAPAVRRRIAAALAHGGTESAAVAAAHALLDEDAGVVNAAARSLAEELPSTSEPHRRALADHLIATLRKGRKPAVPPASEAAMLRVLTAIREPRAEEVYWSYIDNKKPAGVRAMALQALGSLPPPKSDPKLQRLLTCAAEPDFQVAAPALLVLKQVPASKKHVKNWLKLLHAPDPGTRRFAVEKLQDVHTPEVAKSLQAQVSQPDQGLREQAMAALSQSKPGRLALVTTLLAAETPDRAWPVARSLAPFAVELPKPARQRLFTQACELWDKDDRRADSLWFLLREMDADWTAEQMEQRALGLRKKRDYPRALGYLRLLARDRDCRDETRFELAATGLKLSSRDLAPEARQADPCLNQFARLLQNAAFKLTSHVKKAKWLEPEELFYLGFHFAEQNRREKEFGGEILNLLVKKSPRSQLGKDARRKLKSEGLD